MHLPATPRSYYLLDHCNSYYSISSRKSNNYSTKHKNYFAFCQRKNVRLSQTWRTLAQTLKGPGLQITRNRTSRLLKQQWSIKNIWVHPSHNLQRWPWSQVKRKRKMFFRWVLSSTFYWPTLKMLQVIKINFLLTLSIRMVNYDLFSVFQGSLLVIVIMIDGNEKRNCEGGQGGFWTLEFACLWKVESWVNSLAWVLDFRVLVPLFYSWPDSTLRVLKVTFRVERSRLRAVSYFSLQNYCTRNPSTRAAINEEADPRRENLVSSLSLILT